MSSLIVPVFAGKPDPKPKKNTPTPEYHVILGDPETGPIYWEGDTNVGVNKVGIGVRVYFNNKDPYAEEFSVKFFEGWPGVLIDGTEENPITVIGSDHLAVNIWWKRKQQIQLARMSLAFYDADGVEWLLKAEGTEIIKVSDGEYTITFSGFSLTEIGYPIGPYEPLVTPLDITLSFSSNS
jgi:hypothetical protein